jgi:citrate lyase subunit beta / citryl-CoA lyase
MSSDLGGARSFLFVPGNRPDRFAKAAAAGADQIIIDLEDAVGIGHKDEARQAAAAWLSTAGLTLVRLNAPRSPWFEADLAMLQGAPRRVMLPKASVGDVHEVAGGLPRGSQIVALIETAAGLEEASAIGRVHTVARLAFGNIDLAASLGVEPDDHQALLYARSALVLASAAARLSPPVDGVSLELTDLARVEGDARHGVRVGFTGKLCIHPSQIEAVHKSLRPTDEQRERAERILTASRDGDVTSLDGKMIDRPVVEWAQRISARTR